MTSGFFWKEGGGLPVLCVNCGGGEFTEVRDACFQVVHGAIVECKQCGTVFHDTGEEDSPTTTGANTPDKEQ